MDYRPQRRTSARDSLGAACLLSVMLAAVGCAGSEPTANGGPRDGYWVGDDLSFTLRDGHVEALVIHKASCTDDAGCSVDYGGAIAGRWLGVPSIRIEADGYTVEGVFSNRFQVAGSVVMAAPGACCKVVAAWAADHQGPLPTPGLDADATDDGGQRGPVDWGGQSLGDLHPGPAQPVGPATGSDTLSATQQRAHAELSRVRAAIGAGPIAQDGALAEAAQAHAAFYVEHIQQYQSNKLSPHAEDASFGAGFTGVNAGERVAKAGFSGPPGAEVMAFTGSAAGAIRGWMTTVYHRLPLVAPTSERFGYGADKGGSACEVMDFSARGPRTSDPVVVFPWPGQTDVDRSWAGNEGPQPQPPASGYPSGPVITARIPGVTAWTAHTLEDTNGDAIPHVFLDAQNDANMKLFDRFAMAMYSDTPLAAGATYTVRLGATVAGAARTLAWRFTTK